MKRIFYLSLFVIFMTGSGASGSDENDISYKPQEEVREPDYLQEGIKDLKEHDIKKAVADFHRAIAQNPQDNESYLMLGKLYMEMKRYNKAIELFISAGKIQPDNGKIFFTLAKCYGLAGNNQEAISSVKKSVLIFKAQKDDKNYKTALALLNVLMNRDMATTPGKEEE